jgi:protein involved in polysaccharide export with SLBB domain
MRKPIQMLARWGAAFLILFVFTTAGKAQTTDPALMQQARQEIQRRGLDEAEVRARLLQRGIDMDRVTPEQLPQLQETVLQVINELEAEKAQQKQTVPAQPAPATRPPETQTKPPAPAPEQIARDRSERIQQKVKQGVSIEEAIAEELSDTASLPPARVWGQHLFRDKSLSIFRTTNEVKPPDSYVLSSGDVITISIFGASQFDSQFEIAKDGYIAPTGMPKIFLKGIRLGQAKELLRSRFSNFYRFAPEQFAVSLTTARSITVNIFGETANYGSFSLSAINTAFNALIAAGGPTDLGSVRNIKVMRGKDSKRLDIYEFMSNPAVQYDFFLEDNDIVHVPVAERVVGIRGAVRRPFRYELIGGEDLTKLLEFAGGLNANAYREVIQVQRFVDDRQVLLDVNLKEILANKQDFTLQNGDEVIVRAIPSPIENTASVEGSVELPGKYSLAETKRISDLLRRGVLRREARTDAAFLLRTNPDNSTRLIQLSINEILAAPGSEQDLVLQPKDLLTVYSQGRYTDLGSISIVGAVRDTLMNYPYTQDSSLTLQRAVLLAGGLRPDANGMGLITRNDPSNIKELEYVEVDLAAAFDNPNSPFNIVLQPFDRLEVMSRSTFADTAYIKVGGAVRRPGAFIYGKNMSLRDALLLAGGLKLEAAYNRVDIFRVQIRESQPTRAIVATVQVDSNLVTPGGYSIYPYDEIVVRNVPEFEFQRFVEVQGEVRYPGRYALINDNETLWDVIERAGNLTPEAFASGASLFRAEAQKGYIVTNLEEALRNPSSSYNHILKEGDIIKVPKREDLVSIRTANTKAAEIITAQLIANGLINVAHTKHKRAHWYIFEYAAGFGQNAKRTRVTVEQPNGKINHTRNFLIFKSYPKVTPGSIINVGSKPVKPKKAAREKKEFDWDKAFTQILATVGTLATVAVAVAALKN